MAKTTKTKIVKKGRYDMVKKIIRGMIIAALGGVFIFYFCIALPMRRNYDKKLADMPISNVDLTKIPDGSYPGSYDTDMIAAKVQVEMEDHKIKDIHLVYHKTQRGKNAESIINEIKSAQSLKVDTITGATDSSKVILMAIQNALDSAVKN